MKSTLRFVLSLLLVLFFVKDAALAQKHTIDDFYKVDSLANEAKPKEALALVEKIAVQARVANNTSLLIKSVLYRMRFQSYLEENSFDQVLANLHEDIAKAKQPEKSILQSLLAETYWKYHEQNSWKIEQRTNVQGYIGDNINTWSNQKITQGVINTYLLSLTEVELLKQTKVDILNAVLVGDITTRKFRPTLYDLLAHRALDVFLNTRLTIVETGNNTDIYQPIWLANGKVFMDAVIDQNDSSSFTNQALKLFKALLIFHQNDAAALADVDLKRLKFVFQRNSSEEAKETYKKSLISLAEQCKSTEVYADVMFELANLYSSEKTAALSQIEAVKFAKMGIDTYPQSMGASNSKSLLKQIYNKELSFKIKTHLQPNKPAQVLFTYRNIDTIYLHIYKTNQTRRAINLNDKEIFDDFLEHNKPIKDWFVIVPKNSDYRTHTLMDKLEGLPLGSYVLMARTTKQRTAATKYNFNFLKVTSLIVSARRTENNQTYLVRDINGNPLKGVEIQQRKYEYNTGIDYDLDKLTTDADGYAFTENNDNNAYAVIQYGKDLLTIENYNSYYGRDNDDEEDEKVVLFTDRSIYRPGQTIYFKGLYFAISNGKNQIKPNEKVNLTFKDANHKEITRTEFITNEYGTFQGSFAIPIGKLNGTMYLTSTFGSTTIQVEEYKRPTFEIVFDKYDKTYKLNDSIKVTGNALALAGYAIGDAKISYKVFRRLIYDHRTSATTMYAIYGSRAYSRDQIGIGQSKTAANGKFSFSFFSKAINKANYTYEIEVEITDANGETRTKTTSINIGDKNMVLNVNASQSLFLENKPDSLAFSITNLNQEPIKAQVKAKWQLLQAPSRLMNNSPFYAENYTLGKEEFIKNFPNDDYDNELEIAKWRVNTTVYEQNLFVENGLGNLVATGKNLKPGYYKISIQAQNEALDTVSFDKYLVIYDEQPSNISMNIEWVVPEKTVIKPTEEAIFRLAGLSNTSKLFYEVYYRKQVIEKKWISVSPKQTFLSIKPKANFEDGFAVQFTMVYNGEVYNSLQNIAIVDKGKQLDIKFLTFRDKLQPGEKESWKLKISSKKGEKQMAEMVATLYDASLEKLRPLTWETDLTRTFSYDFYNWSQKNGTLSIGQTPWFFNNNNYHNPINRSYENLNLFGYNYYGDYNQGYRNYMNSIRSVNKTPSTPVLKPEALKRLADLEKGKFIYGVVYDASTMYPIPGVKVQIGKINATTNALGIYQIDAKVNQEIKISFLGYLNQTIKVANKKRIDIKLSSEQNGLNEVVIVGYGTQRKESMTASASVTVRGVASTLQGKVAGVSMESNVTGLPIIEDLKKSDPGMKDPTLRQEVEALKQKQPISTRTNFNETAFFYPQLRTDEKGEINIEFTVPQSLTRYKMMGFAHTRDFKTASISKELITQKQLAISINAPRFFREGDTILLSAKLNNLAGKNLKGNASLELKDALTGKAIQLFANKETSERGFEVDDKGSAILKWTLVIPANLQAITYKVIATSGKFSDGEEMTIPVLPNSMLVTETMPINVRGNSNKNFTFEKLLNSGQSTTLRHQSLTFEFTSNPVWYAVQALPYLMEYPYECAEQTFSRFYANSFATGIINSSPKIKGVFEQWQNANNGQALISNLEKNQELKTILLEETPWVRNAVNETERKKRLATLFDLNRMTYELKQNFEKLEKMQHYNGAFPWFTGMEDNRYITQHIVLGMGQLRKLKLIDDRAFPKFNGMLNKAIIYLDALLVKDYKDEMAGKGTGYLPLHYLYARSYTDQKNTDLTFVKARDFYLSKIAKDWKTMSTYQLAQTALVLNRFGHKLEAQKVITLLKQTAQQSDEMGMFWKNNVAGWWWYQSPIETQALLIEAFGEVANDTNAVEEMKIWLLKNKQTNDWKTTKATTAACYALLMKGYDLLSENIEPEIKIGKTSLMEFRPADSKREAGTGYEKITLSGVAVQPAMASVKVKNNNQNIAWGAMYWQYFEQLDKITPSNTGIKIKKQLFIRNMTTNGDILTPISVANPLKVGDLIKVRIEIYADRSMEYVHLKDMRSAGFEPVNVMSSYKYQDGLGYYETTKDASTNFFIGYLQKGTYVFEYPLRVTHSGNFSNGITSLQCMYAPEFTTNSEGIKVKIN